MRIAVSGLGLVTAMGVGVDENISALRNLRSGIIPSPKILPTFHRIPVAELQIRNEELKQLVGTKEARVISRTALLGVLAAREALKMSGLPGGSRMGLVSSTSVGGMDLTEDFFRDFIQNEDTGRLEKVRMHDCAASTDFIAASCHITGYRTSISTACSSAANAVMAGARLLRHGIVDSVLVGGTDALSAFTLNGFKSLMILDQKVCRPFQEDRAGLNLGEGAGYLVLQREEDVKHPLCFLSGYANSNDAYHQTASSKEGTGAYLAMRKALEMAGVEASEVDYINVHGTGTVNNDLSEGVAMQRLFGDRIPPFSSTKVFTGHTLAAAGGIEAVFSALSIKNGYLYPMFDFKNPMPELGFEPVREFTVRKDLRYVLSNSFGFGGNCSSLLFSR